jgi:hypothetical protein
MVYKEVYKKARFKVVRMIESARSRAIMRRKLRPINIILDVVNHDLLLRKLQLYGFSHLTRNGLKGTWQIGNASLNTF